MFTVFVIFVNFDRQYLMNDTYDSYKICSVRTSCHIVSIGWEAAKSISISLRKTGPKYTRKLCATHFRRELRRDGTREPSGNYRNDRMPASEQFPVGILLILTPAVTLKTTRTLNLEKRLFSKYLLNRSRALHENFRRVAGRIPTSTDKI